MRDWRAHAACAGEPTHLFFPDDKRIERAFMAEARAICATCPVLVECQEYALSFNTNDLQGIWGGMSERQRRIEKNRRQRVMRADAVAEMATWTVTA
jgi:WhiB family redox-sensing transcriptional regulator